MAFAAAAVERAMTYQQVIMRELAGTLTWLQAADILGIDPRSLRRWRARYEQDPVLGLLDRRRQRPSHLTAPRAEVQSTTARESFETLARSKLGGVLPPNLTVGGFLGTSMPAAAPPQSFLESLENIEFMASRIVRS